MSSGVSEKPVSASCSEMNQLMMPHHANHAGTVFGGVIMSLCDSVAYVCAARHAGPRCVTVSVDRVDFHEPIHIGALVSFHATIHYVGTSSMDIGIRIVAEDLGTGEQRQTNTCFITMVHLDAQGKPAPVPRLVLDTDAERAQYTAAEARRNALRAVHGSQR
jgi:acyl-CoA hydrolase